MTNGISLFATSHPVCGEEIPNGRVRRDGTEILTLGFLLPGRIGASLRRRSPAYWGGRLRPSADTRFSRGCSLATRSASPRLPGCFRSSYSALNSSPVNIGDRSLNTKRHTSRKASQCRANDQSIAFTKPHDANPRTNSDHRTPDPLNQH